MFDTVDLRSNSSIISFAKQFKSQKIVIELIHYLLRSNITRQGLSEDRFNPVIIGKLLSDDDSTKSND